MARERQHGVLGRHARAVVDDRDVADAAAGEADLDVARAGVERVLHQLLHHRGRALDDLAGRDLPLDVGREDGDASHGPP